MVDPVRLAALLQRLEVESAALRRLAAREEREALDEDDLAGVKYRLIVAIEVCIDVGQHIISSEGLKVADDYGDVFEVLGDAGFLPRELVADLRGMTGFRNLLVHGYATVNDARVREILRTRLDDFAAFRRAVAALAGER
jgi:uncharacterized protein YutE (UPF0331/DUF86 family)